MLENIKLVNNNTIAIKDEDGYVLLLINFNQRVSEFTGYRFAKNSFTEKNEKEELIAELLI